jgi:quercetin dioxygenase-like cupin family protein
MSEMNRREMCAALAAFAALAANGMEAQTGASAATDTSVSKVYKFSEMKVTQSSNGGWSRAIMSGTLPTGEVVAAHETMLPPGKMPHPPHQHRDSEFVMIREGQLEFYNEGKPEPVGPGDVIYTASNRLHGMKNVGTTNALYFVVEISKKDA